MVPTAKSSKRHRSYRKVVSSEEEYPKATINMVGRGLLPLNMILHIMNVNKFLLLTMQ